MPKGGHYAKTRDRRSGRRRLLHRVLAEQTLGRPLLATEIVHHRDGNPRNNAPENLLVLPSQAYHAHVEALLRREKTGMPTLFPELLQEIKAQRHGTLWDGISLQ
ncbi:HNH endonuclease [Deinococcus fonticola]|uniref:HNH endonuclease n=1 Tax=Deinococcus fonticola TaxID=2528713 RepID=UPI001074DF23|nr:HNH endonuclease [Deinococcus fonticola]